MTKEILKLKILEQSFLSVLVIVGALFVFAGNGADGTSKKIYYAIAACLWILAAVLAYLLLLLRLP